jgi:hypothetical protein
VFENRLLRISGPKREEIVGGLRKLHNEEFHNFYFSPEIIRMIKSRMMRWAGYVVRMGRGGMHIGFWWGSQKERVHQEDLPRICMLENNMKTRLREIRLGGME